MSDRVRSIEEVRALLEARGAAPRAGPGASALHLRVHVAGRLTEVIIEWSDLVLQVALPLPFSADPARRDAVSIAANAINARSTLLGFVVDGATGAVMFRSAAVLDPDKSLSVHVLDAILTTTLGSADAHAAALAEAAGLTLSGPLRAHRPDAP